MLKFALTVRHRSKRLLACAMLMCTAPLVAQQPAGVGAPIDGDLVSSSAPATSPATAGASHAQAASSQSTGVQTAPAQTATASKRTTYQRDDLVGAAEGVFGKGAAGLAEVIEDLLRKQGEPNAYIVGREGGGAIIVGLRYGSGTLFHKVHGQKPVYWTGPSVGFDAGANAASTFALIYNLPDNDTVFSRFAAGEGQAYLVGGFHVSYLRRGNIVLIPVRSGAGLRLGVNAGYMKFSRKQNWFPF